MNHQDEIDHEELRWQSENNDLRDSIKYDHRAITLAELREAINVRFRWETPEQQKIVVCFIASQFSNADDEKYCEICDYLGAP